MSSTNEELETIPVICTSHISSKDRKKLEGWRVNPTCSNYEARISLSALVTMENEYGWILHLSNFEGDDTFFKHLKNEFSVDLVKLLKYYKNKNYNYVWLDSSANENPELRVFND